MNNEQQTPQEQQDKKPMDLKTKVLGPYTQYDITTLRNTIAAGLNGNEFGLFINTAISAGLNPFLGQIIPVIYSPEDPNKRKLNIQIPVEGIEHLARQKEGWQGVETQLVCEKDIFKVKRDKETGQWVIEEHEISFPRGRTIGAYCIAKRQGFKDVYTFMEIGEVEHLTKDWRTKDMWGKWFNDMFKKHIKKRALREQFGIELDDMENVAGGPQQYDSNSNLDNYETQERKEVGQDPGEQEPDFNQELQNLYSEMEQLVKEYGLTVDEVNDIKRRRINLEPNDPMEPQQVALLKRFIELEGPNYKADKQQRKEELKQATSYQYREGAAETAEEEPQQGRETPQQDQGKEIHQEEEKQQEEPNQEPQDWSKKQLDNPDDMENFFNFDDNGQGALI